MWKALSDIWKALSDCGHGGKLRPRRLW
jgi:hypothetical protein